MYQFRNISREAASPSFFEAPGNLTSTVAYLVPPVGVILAFGEKQNSFVRFHAWQSSLLFIGVLVVGFALALLATLTAAVLDYTVAGIFGLLSFAAYATYFAAIVFGAYQAYAGRYISYPIVGRLAAKRV